MPKLRKPLDIVTAARSQIRRIQNWTADYDSDGFRAESAEQLRYACERAFIALGEAIKDLSAAADLYALYPEGPWSDTVRFRHFLAHDYDDSALPPLVWDTIQRDLPELDAALAAVELALRK